MTDSSKTSRTRNVLANWAGYVFSAAVSFVLSPFIVHSLGDAAYGVWVLLTSLVGYLGLLDLGVRGAVTRYVAKFHSESSHQDASQVASAALAVFLMAGFGALVIASICAFFVVSFFDVPPELQSQARIIVVIGGLNIAVSLISGVWGGIIAGLQRFDYINAAEVATGAIRAIVIVAALQTGYGLVALALIQLGVSALKALANLWVSRRIYPGLRVSLFNTSRPYLSLIFSFSISAFLLQTSGMLILYSDAIVIGVALPLSFVTFFAIAGNLIEYARAPISGISHTMNPWASALDAQGKRDELRTGFLSAAKVATLIILPIILTFSLRGSSFIALWMGQRYAELSGSVLQILSLGLGFAVANQIVTATMMGISRHKVLVPVFLTEAACNIALSLFLVRHFGIIGVAWGTAIPRLAVSTLFAPFYVRYVLGIPVSTFWTTIWVRPLLAMLPFAIGSYLVELRWPATGLIQFFLQVAATLLLAAGGVWLFALARAEKSTLINRWRHAVQT